MNILDFLKTNRTVALYIVLGIIGTAVAIAAIYFGGNLYQGNLQLQQAQIVETTVNPNLQTVTSLVAPPVTCSGTPNPATLGATVQWTMNTDDLAQYLEEQGHLGIQEYLWEVDGQEMEGETIQVTYSEPQSTATVTTKIIYLIKPSIIKQKKLKKKI